MGFFLFFPCVWIRVLSNGSDTSAPNLLSLPFGGLALQLQLPPQEK